MFETCRRAHASQAFRKQRIVWQDRAPDAREGVKGVAEEKEENLWFKPSSKLGWNTPSTVLVEEICQGTSESEVAGDEGGKPGRKPSQKLKDRKDQPVKGRVEDSLPSGARSCGITRRMELSAEGFWEFLYSDRWQDTCLVRVLHGRLLDDLLSALYSLEEHHDVVSFLTMAYIENDCKAECRKIPDTEATTFVEHILVELDYFSPKPPAQTDPEIMGTTKTDPAETSSTRLDSFDFSFPSPSDQPADASSRLQSRHPSEIATSGSKSLAASFESGVTTSEPVTDGEESDKPFNAYSQSEKPETDRMSRSVSYVADIRIDSWSRGVSFESDITTAGWKPRSVAEVTASQSRVCDVTTDDSRSSVSGVPCVSDNMKSESALDDRARLSRLDSQVGWGTTRRSVLKAAKRWTYRRKLRRITHAKQGVGRRRTSGPFSVDIAPEASSQRFSTDHKQAPSLSGSGIVPNDLSCRARGPSEVDVVGTGERPGVDVRTRGLSGLDVRAREWSGQDVSAGLGPDLLDEEALAREERKRMLRQNMLCVVPPRVLDKWQAERPRSDEDSGPARARCDVRGMLRPPPHADCRQPFHMVREPVLVRRYREGSAFPVLLPDAGRGDQQNLDIQSGDSTGEGVNGPALVSSPTKLSVSDVGIRQSCPKIGKKSSGEMTSSVWSSPRSKTVPYLYGGTSPGSLKKGESATGTITRTLSFTQRRGILPPVFGTREGRKQYKMKFICKKVVHALAFTSEANQKKRRGDDGAETVASDPFLVRQPSNTETISRHLSLRTPSQVFQQDTRPARTSRLEDEKEEDEKEVFETKIDLLRANELQEDVKYMTSNWYARPDDRPVWPHTGPRSLKEALKRRNEQLRKDTCVDVVAGSTPAEEPIKDKPCILPAIKKKEKVVHKQKKPPVHVDVRSLVKHWEKPPTFLEFYNYLDECKNTDTEHTRGSKLRRRGRKARSAGKEKKKATEQIPESGAEEKEQETREKDETEQKEKGQEEKETEEKRTEEKATEEKRTRKSKKKEKEQKELEQARKEKEEKKKKEQEKKEKAKADEQERQEILKAIQLKKVLAAGKSQLLTDEQRKLVRRAGLIFHSNDPWHISERFARLAGGVSDSVGVYKALTERRERMIRLVEEGKQLLSFEEEIKRNLQAKTATAQSPAPEKPKGIGKTKEEANYDKILSQLRGDKSKKVVLLDPKNEQKKAEREKKRLALKEGLAARKLLREERKILTEVGFGQVFDTNKLKHSHSFEEIFEKKQDETDKKEYLKLKEKYARPCTKIDPELFKPARKTIQEDDDKREALSVAPSGTSKVSDGRQTRSSASSQRSNPVRNTLKPTDKNTKKIPGRVQLPSIHRGRQMLPRERGNRTHAVTLDTKVHSPPPPEPEPPTLGKLRQFRFLKYRDYEPRTLSLSPLPGNVMTSTDFRDRLLQAMKDFLVRKERATSSRHFKSRVSVTFTRRRPAATDAGEPVMADARRLVAHVCNTLREGNETAGTLVPC